MMTTRTHRKWCEGASPVNPHGKRGTCPRCGYVGHVTKYGGMRPHLRRDVTEDPR